MTTNAQHKEISKGRLILVDSAVECLHRYLAFAFVLGDSPTIRSRLIDAARDAHRELHHLLDEYDSSGGP